MKYNIVKQDETIYITFETHIYIIDSEQVKMLKKKNFNFDITVSEYHYYNYNNQIITILEYLNNIRCKNIIIKFKNNNRFDIRKSNIIILHEKYSEIDTDYEIINYIQGHIITQGIDSGYMKNPIWEVKDCNDNIFLLMYCETNTFVKLCKKSLSIIKDFEHKYNEKIIFYACKNGYIQSNIIISIQKRLYMHQIIMNIYGNGKGTMNISVDHINKDITDNTYDNLRIATRKEQETNKLTTGRKKTTLPTGFVPENIPKYVEYHKEILNKETGKYRDCFRISKIPNSNKKWVTSKSMNITIYDKYNQLIDKYKEIYGDVNVIHPNNIISNIL